MSTDIEKPNRDPSLLAPFFLQKVLAALSEIQLMGYDVQIYEGFRSDERQEFLYQSGRDRFGPKVTNARAGMSAHSFGLACDCVGKVKGKWSWDDDLVPYQKFRPVYLKHGLELLNWETAHVQLIKPFTNADLRSLNIQRYVNEHSLQALWSLISGNNLNV
jgi:D-alanyl-D-alanine carboxypeptidase